LIGGFGAMWHPLIAQIRLTGTGVGQLRTVETIDGKVIVERLDATDHARRQYRYSGITGMGASSYTGVLEVAPKGNGSAVTWRVQYLSDGQPTLIIRTIVATLQKVGLESLEKRFG
jgi:carbon monoxide dehydrogenase subunit G